MNVKNRSCIRRLSFKSLKAARKRNSIAILAIALTTLLFTSLFTVALSLNSSYQTYTFRQIGGYCHGTFKDVTEEQAEAIEAHSKVKAVGRRKVAGTITTGVFAKVPAELSYMDENCTKWSYAEPTTGHAPQSGNEIAMDTTALALLGIQPELGAQVTLTYSVTDKDQHLFEKTDTFILAGYWEYDDISPVHYLNISEDYEKLVEAEAVAAGAESFRTDLNVMMVSSIDIRGQMEQVDMDLGYDWETRNEENSVRIGVNWGYTTEQLGQNMDASVLIAILAFLVLVIFTGYLIIYNIFQISVTGDIRFYGLLKTIGVTPRQLRRMIRLQSLFLCVIGLPLGLLAGYGVGAVLVPVVMAQTTYGASFSTLSTSPLIFIVSALFALVTVLLSCARPGRIAAKVSPVEAAKYTEAQTINPRKARKKRNAALQGARIHQMAFANLGRNKLKTVLVVVSLSLSVVLLNLLVMFTNGFDMEKYLEHQSCADFIVSSTDYFRYVIGSEEYISEDVIAEIEANTAQTVSGCGYTTSGISPQGWMTEEAWMANASGYTSNENLEAALSKMPHRDNLVAEYVQIEGFDPALFDKLTLADGDLAPLFDTDSHAIALALDADDYGAVNIPDGYPALGDTLTITYVNDGWYIDTRTGEKSDETTPEEYMQYYISESHDVDYTVCAYVSVPYSMSLRYGNWGYSAVLPADRLEADSGTAAVPLFYLFDTPDEVSEAAAESYMASLTSGDTAPASLASVDLTSLMYESKATIRSEFSSFQQMFLLIGGLLCFIIGLVGILNFFNAILTGILTRKREFAMLQAVGMTGRQLKTMLIYEGMFYTLGSAFIALILSLLLNPLTANLLETMIWFFSARFTILPVLGALPVFALLGWFIPYIMYGQAAKQSVVERLRETE